MAVRINGNIKHTQGCADVSAERGRVWIGVQVSGQDHDEGIVYIIMVTGHHDTSYYLLVSFALIKFGVLLHELI